jgi:GAF domain-containing protein
MSERAFGEIDELCSTIERIRRAYPDDEDLYSRIQQSKDESLYVVFGSLRSTSFYLGNIFEGYLNRFVSGLERQSREIEARILVTYGVASVVIIGFAVAIALLMTRAIAGNMSLVEGALERLAEGDFSSRVEARGSDEIGVLAGRMNMIAERLKRNVGSLSALLADVNLAVPEAPDLDRILAIVTDALLRDKGAECAAIYLLEGERGIRSAWSGFDPFAGRGEPDPGVVAGLASSGEPLVVQDSAADGERLAELGLDEGLRSLLVAPLTVRRRVSGLCLFGRRSRPFTDLEISQLVSFADYAAQVIDNAVAHAALLARRDAEIEALQSQVQPHFLYNVLNGLVALNRMEDRPGLESSLLSLKDLLRHSLGLGRWSTVAEEAAFIEAYCSLQKLRFEERLTYEIRIQPEAAGLVIPRLIAQPLVENAVIHGVEPTLRPTSVLVCAEVEGGDLVMRVRDDGAGCDPTTIREKERVGLGNLRERLGLLYASASLRLEGSAGGGFLAEVRIPVGELGRP